MILSDLALMGGYILASFSAGYGLGFLFYVFRKGAVISTSS
jgi:hypothetical protein